LSKTFKCLLFDLDGTLISTGGAGIRALESAFLRKFQLEGAGRGVDPSGKTDPEIIREMFLKHLGRDCRDEDMQTVQKAYLNTLRAECDRSPKYRVMEGIPELLSKLRKSRILMGLGTGNLEKGAKIKLARAKLNRFFPFGGYGSDSENRTMLLKIAVQKAQRHAGGKLKPEDVIVVGDTVRDIHAAHEAHFKVISVGTGGTPAGKLRSMNPDLYVPNFSRPEKIIRMICQGSL